MSIHRLMAVVEVVVDDENAQGDEVELAVEHFTEGVDNVIRSFGLDTATMRRIS